MTRSGPHQTAPATVSALGSGGSWFAEALDAVAATCRRLHTDLDTDASMADVFDETRPVLSRLGEFETMAFLSIQPDALGYEIEAISDESCRAAVSAEVDHQVAVGAFAWSLYQERPVIVRGGALGIWTVMHVLSTPSRVIGMFIASLPRESPFLPDAVQKALSIVLINCSSVLESVALHAELKGHNASLEGLVEERTRDLKRSERAALSAVHAKSAFLANMSHELRTPINGIMGMASLLTDSPLDAEQRAQVETVARSADNLLEIVNDLLDMSKVDAGQMVLENISFDLEQLVEEVVELFAPPAALKNVEIVANLVVGTPRHIKGDAGRVRQVLTNLLGNAVKFTDSGHIAVDVALAEGGKTLSLSVTDTGIGIDPYKTEHIFQKFTQADSSTTRRFGGTGLGLAISRELAHLMGGDIAVSSVPEQGSVFTFTLPLVVAAPNTSAVDLSGMNVLIVSPRATVSDSIAGIVSGAGGRTHTIESTEGVVDAGDLARGEGRPFDWAVIDCQWHAHSLTALPDTLRVHKKLEGMRLLALVSPGDRNAGAVLEASGYDRWLSRPVRARGLAEVLSGAPLQPQIETALATAKSRLPRSARILLVEDDPVNAAVAAAMLKRLGCEFEAVADGREALVALENGAFDLVLMDCHMPGMDGYEATLAMREREESRIPILALTASAMAEDLERAFEVGMDDHLTKPIKLETLRNALLRWLPDREAGPIDVESPEVAKELDGRQEALPVFDVHEALERAGDWDILDEILEIFMEQWETLHERLSLAVARGDTSDLKSVAHIIKGSAGNLGAKRIAALARDAEDAWAIGELGGAGDRIEAFHSGFQAFRKVSERVRSEGAVA